MKWQGYNEKAAERVTDAITKVFGTRSFYTIVTLAALAAVLAATVKWTG